MMVVGAIFAFDAVTAESSASQQYGLDNSETNIASHPRDALESLDERERLIDHVVPAMPRQRNLTLFCFAWTPRRPLDEVLMKEVRIQFEKCDGHAFFTDVDAPGANESDIIHIAVP